MSKRLVLACLLCSLVVAVAGADIVYTRDGRTIRGTVTRKDDTVVVETADGKTVTVKEEDVLHIAIEAPEPDPEKPVKAAGAPSPAAGTKASPKTGPAKKYTSYFVIPIRGDIGKALTPEGVVQEHVTAHLVRTSFKLIKEPDTTVVILEVDTDGGLVTGEDAIVKVLEAHKGRFRIVAYVKNAISAGAIITLSCEEIVMAPSSQIGGCVLVGGNPDLPTAVAAKYDSVDRAKCRAIAETAGHNPLLVEGMIRLDIVLGLKKTAEGVEIVEGPGDKIIKPEGKILTLTGQEAVTYGLAIGQAASVGECRKLLGIDRWREQSRKGYQLQKAWVKEAEQKRKRLGSLSAEVLALDSKISVLAKRWPKTREKLQTNYSKMLTALKKAEYIAEKYPALLLPGEADRIAGMRAEADWWRNWLKSDEAKRR